MSLTIKDRVLLSGRRESFILDFPPTSLIFHPSKHAAKLVQAVEEGVGVHSWAGFCACLGCNL